MRNRGQVYWEWANPELHFRNQDERLPCGSLINIQARISKEGVTQLFYGIYGVKGLALHEEYHPACEGQTISTAMAWARQRALQWAAETMSGTG